MNIFVMIIDAVASFVRRNPIFCLVMLILALGAPSLLAGIAAVVLYAVLGVILLALVFSLLLRWRIYKLHRHMEDSFGENPFGPRRPAEEREGDVKIYRRRDAGEKRVSDRVGDYVDFEEEKHSK